MINNDQNLVFCVTLYYKTFYNEKLELSAIFDFCIDAQDVFVDNIVVFTK